TLGGTGGGVTNRLRGRPACHVSHRNDVITNATRLAHVGPPPTPSLPTRAPPLPIFGGAYPDAKRVEYDLACAEGPSRIHRAAQIRRGKRWTGSRASMTEDNAVEPSPRRLLVRHEW